MVQQSSHFTPVAAKGNCSMLIDENGEQIADQEAVDPKHRVTLRDRSLDERVELHKAVGAIYISASQLSLLQRKCFNFLLHNAKKQGIKPGQPNVMSIADLRFYTDFNSNDYDYLKTRLKRLISTIIEFDTVGASKEKDEWTASTLLSQVSMKNGMIYYDFPPWLKEKLDMPSIFSKLDLLRMNNLTSVYSYNLYEAIVGFKKIGKSSWWTVEEVKMFIGVDPSNKAYVEFKSFNRSVLQHAIKDINLNSDIEIEVNFRKEGRTIVAMQFAIKVKPDPAILTDSTPDSARQSLLERMVECGLHEIEAKTYLIDHKLDIIEFSVRKMEDYRKSGKKIGNPAALFRTIFNDAVEIGHKLNSSPEVAGLSVVKQSENKPAKSVPAHKPKSEIETIRTSFSLLDDETKNVTIERFLSTSTPIVREAFNNHGFSAKSFNTAFFNWLHANLAELGMQKLLSQSN